jgi:hypothetical protein
MADSTVSTPARSRRPDWEDRFIQVFAATGNVRLSATAAGVSRDAPYKRAQSDRNFAAEWLRAREDAVDILEAEARRRALNSSDALLIFLLKSLRPETFRDRVDLTVDLRRQADRIARDLGLNAEGLIAEAERILEMSEL